MVHEGVVIDGASADNNEVLASVVGSLELVEHVNVDVLKAIAVSTDRLSHHVVSEGVEVASLKSGGLLVLVHVIVLLGLLLLGDFELSSIESGVVDGISEHGESSANITLHAGNLQVSDLAVSFGSNSGTHAFNFFSKLALGGTLGASQKHLGQQVSSACSLKSVLAGSGLDVNTNAVA